MERLICLLGLICFIAMAWSISTDRRSFPWRVVLGGVGLQFVLAFLVLKTTPGRAVIEIVGDMFVATLGCVRAGSGFVFGSGDAAFSDSLIATFAFGVLPTIIFFSSLMAILYHIGVMQKLVSALAWVMRHTLGTSGTETLAAAANVFVGQTEAPLVIRPYLARMTKSELMAMMTGGFATVAGGVLAAYAEMGIDVRHLMTASVISAPAALLIAKVMVPESEDAVPSDQVTMAKVSDDDNLIGAAVSGASEGLMLALNVGAMLIAFLGLIALLDLILATLCGYAGWVTDSGDPQLTLGIILSYLFWPFAWLLGIPTTECLEAGRLIGLKTVANEFLAFADLSELRKLDQPPLSPRSVVILTYALAGFSNFSSIGIVVGGVGGLEPSRKADLSRFALRAMFGGLLACLMTAAVAGVLLTDPVLPTKSTTTDEPTATGTVNLPSEESADNSKRSNN